ncbi:MAG: dephospho-CoA kinase [Deltaproteobacteria bacterium]|nr:dephospho-CoA kinase [Deltaproteobacteria bacterium]
MILGVTGGIASGKTTVANMLAELGAPIIDFDLLARKVVRPGTPAFREIVDYFGDQVIGGDGTLDRKRLSGIVFSDAAKRKILEGITHPRIVAAFVREARQLAESDPHGIVQAVIPLLFEGNLHHLVHKILVVYVSPETQIKRLTKRDTITREEANRILDSQMPIDQKVAQADFVIRNEGSIEETRHAANALWQSLQAVRKTGAGSV